jgi:hypothetical protein
MRLAMKKQDYLKEAFNYLTLNQVSEKIKRDWYISMMALVTKPTDLVYEYKLTRDLSGYFFVKDNANIRIEDADQTQPLFSINEPITISSGWVDNYNQNKPLETTFGRLMINRECLAKPFLNKIEYINRKITVKDLEKLIILRLKDTPDDPSKKEDQFIYVDEYIQFVNGLSLITGLTSIISVSITKRAITTAPGFKEYKEKVDKEFEGALSDPVRLSEYEKKLQAFDDDYLKNDPAFGVIIAGKVRNTGRKRMYLTYGAERTFEETAKVNPIIKSLNEGWDTDPDKFRTYIDAMRAGSYGRGAETINGGVAAKTLLRAINSFKVESKDCGTLRGLKRTIHDHSAYKLVNRYIKENKTWVKVKTIEEAKKYIGQTLEMRSPLYCEQKGDALCSHCMGEYYSENPNGIVTSILDMSSAIMGIFMSAIHGKELSTETYDINEILS